jgi:hypothetical protein
MNPATAVLVGVALFDTMHRRPDGHNLLEALDHAEPAIRRSGVVDSAQKQLWYDCDRFLK